jgi:RND superfamily putative drug exporter
LPHPKERLLTARFARWCFLRRKFVLLAWLIALVLIGGIARSVGSAYSTNFSFPATDSSEALNIVKANFPSQSGDRSASALP